MSPKPIPHSISSRLDDIKGEKCGPKLIILANSFYAYRRRRRTSSNLSGRVPSLLIKFSPEEHTACVMQPITDSSRTHVTRPDSGDSTPSAELSVHLHTPALLIMFSLFSFLALFTFFTQSIKYSADARITLAALCVLTIPGGFSDRRLLLLLSLEHQAHHICVFSSYVPFLRHYMHRYDLSFGQAGLPGSCAYALHSR